MISGLTYEWPIPSYQPQKCNWKYGANGYSDVQIDQRTFLVIYLAHAGRKSFMSDMSGVSLEQYLRLRCAELALGKGYKGFIVLNRYKGDYYQRVRYSGFHRLKVVALIRLVGDADPVELNYPREDASQIYEEFKYLVSQGGN
jgi:hypothetical protein